MNHAKFKAALADPKARRELLRAASKAQHNGPEDGYTVTYTIDVDAASVEDAARVAEDLMLNPRFRYCLGVRNNKTGETTTIDLEDPC